MFLTNLVPLQEQKLTLIPYDTYMWLKIDIQYVN